jgi:hypothetical protein
LNQTHRYPHLHKKAQEHLQQTENFPTHSTILTIIGGSNTDFETKRQRRDYYHQVNHVAVEGPITQTKWSHMPIIFSSQDINLTSFPHTDAMVVTVHIDRWDVTKILIDNGSQAEILFLATFDKMRFDRKQLREPSKPLYGFSRKRIEPIGAITLLVSFGTPKNHHTEYITFDVLNMTYSYNTIFGRGLLNTFKAAWHLTYLCLKVPITFGVITVFGSQQEAKNIEKGFAPGHKNIHFLREQQEQQEAQPLTECRKFIEAEGEFKKVPLDQRVPDKMICIGTEANQQDQTKLLSFLDKNSDVFAWSTSDLVGVSRDVIEH